MRFSLEFEQVIEYTPRFIFRQLVDPRRERRVRIDRFLTRDLVRPHDRVIGSELVSTVLRVSSRFSSEFVSVFTGLLSESVGIVVTGQAIEELLVARREGRVGVVVGLPHRAGEGREKNVRI